MAARPGDKDSIYDIPGYELNLSQKQSVAQQEVLHPEYLLLKKILSKAGHQGQDSNTEISVLYGVLTYSIVIH